MEHLALHSNLPLKDFCDRLAELFDMPDFEFDHENETEWGESKKEDMTFNVNRPYEKGTLSKWDDTVPEKCNYGISITKPRFDQNEILKIGQSIADKFHVTVFYHRTWVKPGQNIKRKIKIKTSYNNT